MIKFKRFSIQSGKPKKSSGLLGEFGRKTKRYAPIGAAVGAAYGLIDEDESMFKSAVKGVAIGVMLAALDTAMSYMRRKDIKKASANEIISKLRTKSPITPNDYTINSDPYSSKLSVAMGGGAMVMWINDLNEVEITEISNKLDEACLESRYADYKSQPMEKGGYLVTALLSGMDQVCELLTHIINELGIKINIVSELSQANRAFSLKEKYDEYRAKAKDRIKRSIKNNKYVRNIDKVDPGMSDRVMNEMSLDPLFERVKGLEEYGKDIIYRP